MSFIFSFKACKNIDGKNIYDHPNDPEKWHPVAEALAFVTMTIGIGSITEKNADKFFERLSLYQAVTGPLIRYGDGTKTYITLEDVKDYIGMTTNASNYGDAQWKKRIIEIASRYPANNHGKAFKTARECVAIQAAKYAKKENAS